MPVSKVTEQDEEELKHYKGYYGDPWDKLFKEVSAVGLVAQSGIVLVFPFWRPDFDSCSDRWCITLVSAQPPVGNTAYFGSLAMGINSIEGYWHSLF